MAAEAGQAAEPLGGENFGDAEVLALLELVRTALERRGYVVPVAARKMIPRSA